MARWFVARGAVRLAQTRYDRKKKRHVPTDPVVVEAGQLLPEDVEETHPFILRRLQRVRRVRLVSDADAARLEDGGTGEEIPESGWEEPEHVGNGWYVVRGQDKKIRGERTARVLQAKGYGLPSPPEKQEETPDEPPADGTASTATTEVNVPADAADGTVAGDGETASTATADDTDTGTGTSTTLTEGGVAPADSTAENVSGTDEPVVPATPEQPSAEWSEPKHTGNGWYVIEGREDKVQGRDAARQAQAEALGLSEPPPRNE